MPPVAILFAARPASARTRRCALAMRALTVAALLSGCDGAGARLFSVTVVEPLTIECSAETFDTEFFDEEDIEQAAAETRRSYKRDKERFPPTAQGRVLHLIEIESEVRAWFESRDQSGDISTGFGPVVFAGDIHEGYFEGRYQAVINTDEDDEDAERELCGPRPYLLGTFSATDVDNTLLGRIRWEERIYYSSNLSACAAIISCTRDVSVWGAEQ